MISRLFWNSHEKLHVFVCVVATKSLRRKRRLLLMVPTSPAGIPLAWHILFFPLQKLYEDKQGQDQNILSSWISCSSIRFHGGGEATIGFDSFNTLSLCSMNTYLGLEGLKILSFKHQVSSYLLLQGQPVFLFLLWLLKSFFICGCDPEQQSHQAWNNSERGIVLCFWHSSVTPWG